MNKCLFFQSWFSLLLCIMGQMNLLRLNIKLFMNRCLQVYFKNSFYSFIFPILRPDFCLCISWSLFLQKHQTTINYIKIVSNAIILYNYSITIHYSLETEFKVLKFKPRLKYGWCHLKLYSIFQDLSQGSIEIGFQGI